MTSPWCIFDADNTLWDIEALYNSARDQFCKFMADLGHDRSTVERYQRKRDAELQRHYGYSAARFARSFEDTYLSFEEKENIEHLREVRSFAESVFSQKAKMYDGVEIVLRSLKASNYQLGLLTAGETWVQVKRLADFHLEGIFSGVEIVREKSSDEFLRFCKKHEVDISQSWVIGDSIRSDIGPARAAGLKAIWLRHLNWHEVEGSGPQVALDYSIADAPIDVLRILGIRKLDLRPKSDGRIKAIGIFEGGGAKGLAHAGALKAAEDRKVDFVAVAGTSAGAMIAGLVAVKYSADELFDVARRSGVLALNYLDVLGRDEWNRAAEFISNDLSP